MSDAKIRTFKKPSAISFKQMCKLILSLLVVTVVAALILSLVNTLTVGTIAARKEEARIQAMANILPQAEHFSDLYNTDPTIDRITGGYVGINLVGYCVEVAPNGFGGAITLMVGVNSSGSVTGVSILEHRETAGLGAKAEDPYFLDQYLGKSGTIEVNTGENSIDAITNATITSKAITDGVNRALQTVLNYNTEGGETDV